VAEKPAGGTGQSAIGLFGGTFDPVHFGHLRLATELAEAFHLDKVVFIPAGLPYHRGRDAHATAEERLTMLKLATARDARFDVDDRELKRSGNTYTYDTLAEIRGEHPATPLVFLIGTDSFAQIDSWHRWTELFDLAHFAVAVRANDENWLAKGPGVFPRQVWPRITLNPRDLQAAPAGKVMTFAMTPLSISSTALRAIAGEGTSLRYLTPNAVVEFIRSHNLYGAARDRRAALDKDTR
jgi:nicotinate-nucleotide adenylyltransferase